MILLSGFIDLSGQRFGRWTVLERADDYIRKDGKKDTCYKCLCDCGNEKIIRARYLTCGNSKSCGCYRSEYERNRMTTHGMTNTRIFKIWDGMINRCRNKRENTKHWNGKGINVCDEWQGNNGFINFYNWSMANGYEDSLTIDRKDGDKDYCPENCRWVDYYTQNNNSSQNRFICYKGQKKTIGELAREYGLKYKTLYSRINNGMDIEKALTKKAGVTDGCSV